MATVEHCLYCFDVLTAYHEERSEMSLQYVHESWKDYPKGLELGDSDFGEEEKANEPPATQSRLPSTTDQTSRTPRIPLIQRLTRSTSGSSTPSSNTSSERNSTSTSATTPSSSTTSFTPIGIHPSTRSRNQSPSLKIQNWSTPLFVTWNTISTSDHPQIDSPTLRGCIGTFSSEPLITGLKEYALHSALQDTRFNPITKAELPTLEVAVTLLTDFETCEHPLDWELGVHGIRISFYNKSRRYGACYLPDVAVEQGWSKEETVVSAMRKAGWGGRKEKWREVGQLKVIRFQGRKESVTWNEYDDWRNWEKGQGKEELAR